MLSAAFLFFYGLELSIMLVYALLWQRILKRFELSVAYANRPVVTIFGMIWGVLLFHEQFTWNMAVGMVIIVLGIYIVVTGEEK